MRPGMTRWSECRNPVKFSESLTFLASSAANSTMTQAKSTTLVSSRSIDRSNTAQSLMTHASSKVCLNELTLGETSLTRGHAHAHSEQRRKRHQQIRERCRMSPISAPIEVSSRLSCLSFVTMAVTSHTAYFPLYPFSGDVDVGVSRSMAESISSSLAESIRRSILVRNPNLSFTSIM